MRQKVDFFISYQQADLTWAEWVAWHLEANGYTTAFQAWDFRPGANFAQEMQDCIAGSRRLIAILSPDYLRATYVYPEWLSAFAKDPKGKRRTLVPIRVRKCKLQALLAQVLYIDLVDVDDERIAVDKLLSGVKDKRNRPSPKPKYPADKSIAPEEYAPVAVFPNSPSASLIEQYAQLVSAEFKTVRSRRNHPMENSRSCELLFGHGFPFGRKKARPIISRCAVAFDVEQLLAATIGSYCVPSPGAPESFAPSIAYKAASIRWRVLVSTVANGLNAFRRDVLLKPLADGIQSALVEKNVQFRLRQAVSDYVHANDPDDSLGVASRLLYLVGIVCRDNGVSLGELLAEEQRKYRSHLLRPAQNKVRAMQTSTIMVYFKDDEGAYEEILKALSERHANIFASHSWTLVSERVAYSEMEVSFPADMDLRSEMEFLSTRTPLSDLIYSLDMCQQEALV